MKRFASGLLIALPAALLLSPALAQHHGTHQAGQQATTTVEHADDSHGMLTDFEGAEFEIAFLSMMIAHHEGAVDMAEWVLERTERPELREAAEAVIAAQTPEIEQMNAWLRDWHGLEEPDAMMAGMMQGEVATMMENMQGHSDPESAFLVEMTHHHMGALDMAQLALTRAVNPELRTLARDIIIEQARDIHQYQTWLHGE